MLQLLNSVAIFFFIIQLQWLYKCNSDLKYLYNKNNTEF